MNGSSWFPGARTIWAMSRCHRPQGAEHDQGGKTYFDLIYKLECDLNMKLPVDLKNKLCGWKIIYERRAGWKLI